MLNITKERGTDSSCCLLQRDSTPLFFEVTSPIPIQSDDDPDPKFDAGKKIPACNKILCSICVPPNEISRPCFHTNG